MTVADAQRATGLTAPLVYALKICADVDGPISVGSSNRLDKHRVNADHLARLESEGLVCQEIRGYVSITTAGRAMLHRWRNEVAS